MSNYKTYSPDNLEDAIIDLGDISKDAEDALTKAAQRDMDCAAVEEARAVHDAVAVLLGRDELPAGGGYDPGELADVVAELVKDGVARCGVCGAPALPERQILRCARCRRAFKLMEVTDGE